MKIRFYNDVHLGANNALMTMQEFIEDVIENWYDKPKDLLLVYLGDNADFANCKKSYIEKLNKFFKDIKKHFDLFATGNHECQGDSDDELNFVDLNGKIYVFLHSDSLSWGKEKSDKYRAKKHGAGWFKRNIWVNALESAELLIDRTNSKKLKKNIETFILSKRYKIDYLFLAHFHPRENICLQILGTKVILLKRGIQTIDTKEL